MVKERKRKLYVEGGGDRNSRLSSECRKAFSKLFQNAGIQQKPGVIACGGRKRAYDWFCNALEEDKDDIWLLVDAEENAPSGPPFEPWAHVKTRKGDHWERPPGATDEQLHFMNAIMETWLLSDHVALKGVLGPKLDLSKLPQPGPDLEKKSKASIYAALKAATRPTPAGKYGKGSHSFKALGLVSPQKLCQLSWAARFLKAMGATCP